MRTLIAVSIVCAATASIAEPFRDGANHHLGDDSFLVAHGRLPVDGDTEKIRMRTHLAHVRDLLAARPATNPALANRRAELLGYLGDYIAHDITPKNTRLPWRTPVFIDDRGAICAVGYLIERSVGRAVAEQVAREHRVDFLEDIAAQMPDVRAWIASSGFTLGELASIQPAYEDPVQDTWRSWDLVRHAPPDGAYDRDGHVGTIDKKSMHGAWTRKDDKGTRIGEGTFDHGAGTWRSYYPDGKQLLARGPYRGNRANGAWTIYHPSGNVAATGMIVNGRRTGEWTFYYDTAKRVPLTKRRFARSGEELASSQTFDAKGKLFASSRAGVLDLVADANGITQHLASTWTEVNPSDFAGDGRVHQLHRLAYRGESLYLFDSGFSETDAFYDAEGHLLERGDDGWSARDCKWSPRRKQIAKSGDVAWLNKLLAKDSHARSVFKETNTYGNHNETKPDPGPGCGAAKLLDQTRSARLDLVLRSREAVRLPAPAFVTSLEEGKGGVIVPPAEPDAREEPKATLPAFPFLGSNHVTARFDQVFGTMAGRYKWLWYHGAHDADGSDVGVNQMKEKDWRAR